MAESSSLFIQTAWYPLTEVSGTINAAAGGTLPTATYSFAARPRYSSATDDPDFIVTGANDTAHWINISITLGDTFTMAWTLNGPIPTAIDIYYSIGSNFGGTSTTVKKVTSLAGTATGYTVTAAGSAPPTLLWARVVTLSQVILSDPVLRPTNTLTATGKSALKSYGGGSPLYALGVVCEHTGITQPEMNVLLRWALEGARLKLIDTQTSAITIPIVEADTASDYFEVTGDYRRYFPTASALPFIVAGSTGNNGTYHTGTVQYFEATNRTRIQPVEAVPDTTNDGNITFTDAFANDCHAITNYFGYIASINQVGTIYKQGDEDLQFTFVCDDIDLEDFSE